MNEKLNFINIIPVWTARPEITVAEIRRKAKEAGLTKTALCLSFHPQGTPAQKNADALLAAHREIRAALKDSGIEVGVLVQSTLGHGWSGKVPLTGEPWQNIVKIDEGKSSRICLLDPGFRRYVIHNIRQLVRDGTPFLMLDDDFGLRWRECICPLHLAEFSEALGRKITQEEAEDMLKNRPWDDPEVKIISDLRRKDITDFAVEIRKAVDEENPAVECIMCSPCNGQGFTDSVALALAGKTAPCIRVDDSIYGEQNPLVFYRLTRRIHMVRHQNPNVHAFIDEADTFPQNYYSESAAVFHAHLVNAVLNGLNGAKLWMSEFSSITEENTQERYEKIFAENRGLYESLHQTLDGAEWQGPVSFLSRPPFLLHILKTFEAFDGQDWTVSMLGPLGYPVNYQEPGRYPVNTLTADILPYLDDAQLHEIFRHGVLIDSGAAKRLTERGFASLMGVRATNGTSDYFFSSERKCGTEEATGMMWDESCACLEPVSAETKTATVFCRGSLRSGDLTEAGPGMTFFTNELGGRIAVTGWTPAGPSAWIKKFRCRKIQWIREAVDFINGGPVEMTVPVDHQVLVRHGRLRGGDELLSVISLGIDAVSEIPVVCSRPVRTLERMTASGAWEPVRFEKKNGSVSLACALRFCVPEIFRFTFAVR